MTKYKTKEKIIKEKKEKKMNECGEGEYVCNEVRMLSKRKKNHFFLFPWGGSSVIFWTAELAPVSRS
jgi:hypothetical protein